MKLNKIALRNFAILLALALGSIACDDEFATIDSDIINDGTATNFDVSSESYEVISYTDVLAPIQTNRIGSYQLGVYNDPTFGQTTASVLAQVGSSTLNPSFGENVILDSVVLTIPYFSTSTGITEENSVSYELDSVFAPSGSLDPIKLSIFENSYFLRDFNPDDVFNSGQPFFSNKSASENETIGDSQLEAITISVIDTLKISNKEIILTDNDGIDQEITQRLSPRIRKVWDKNVVEDAGVINYWNEKILSREGDAVLSNSNNFNDYFRGIYFKAEPIDGSGSMILLNFANTEANFVLHYSFDDTFTEGEREQSSYTLSFNSTVVNFFDNSFNSDFPTQDGDEVNGDENLYLKGGEGSLAGIKLFNGESADDDDTTDNTFEAWRKEFVNVDEDGEFVSAKRLVNEANLIFYVNQEIVEGEEPDRLYLYNRTNGFPLIDYAQDSENTSLPRISIPNHLGILERDENTNEGIRYKMRITSHINNILLNNLGNVELGIAVSSNVNLEGSIGQYLVQTPGTEVETVPISSITSPRSTVLHGNLSSDISKRIVLEIFYTEPN